MNSALQNLSKSELIQRLTDVEKKAQLQVQQLIDLKETTQQKLRRKDQIIAQLQRLLFGQKRERFEGDPAQQSLPFEQQQEQTGEPELRHQETITYVRKKQSRENHKGRVPLPDHLPVEEIEIHPEGDLSGMVCIGKEVTDELEIRPARFYIKRYIRYKYAPKTGQGAPHIGDLPERVIDKGIPGPGLLGACPA